MFGQLLIFKDNFGFKASKTAFGLPPPSPTQTNVIYGQVYRQIVIIFVVFEIFMKVHFCHFELNYG